MQTMTMFLALKSNLTVKTLKTYIGYSIKGMKLDHDYIRLNYYFFVTSFLQKFSTWQKMKNVVSSTDDGCIY